MASCSHSNPRISSNCPDLGLLGATPHAAARAPARRAGDAAEGDAAEGEQHPEADEADEGRQEGRGRAVRGRRRVLPLPGGISTCV